MADIYMYRTLAGLAPVDDEAREALRRIKISGTDPLKVKVTKPRNYQFHKKAFALLKLGHDNLPEKYGNISFEQYRAEALKAIGWSTTYRDFEGREVTEADSMSFARLDDLEFDKRIYQPLIDLTMRLIGVGREDLEMEVLSYAG